MENNKTISEFTIKSNDSVSELRIVIGKNLMQVSVDDATVKLDADGALLAMNNLLLLMPFVAINSSHALNIQEMPRPTSNQLIKKFLDDKEVRESKLLERGNLLTAFMYILESATNKEILLLAEKMFDWIKIEPKYYQLIKGSLEEGNKEIIEAIKKDIDNETTYVNRGHLGRIKQEEVNISDICEMAQKSKNHTNH